MRPRSQLSSNSRRTARNCEYRHLVSLVPQRSHQPDIAAGDRRDERLLCESNSWDISLRMFSGWAYGWPAHEAFASARADSSGVALRGQAGGAHVLGWIEPCNVCVRIGKALQAGLADRRIRNDGERRVTRMMGILIWVVAGSIVAADHRPARMVGAIPIGTVEQVAVAGPKNSKGEQIFPGLLPGGETGPRGWVFWITGQELGKSQQYTLGVGGLANLVYQNPSWDFRTFNFDRDVGLLDDKLGPALNATNPDLQTFKKNGGKLILYHGWSDPGVTPLSTVDYYDRVTSKMGGKNVGEFVRLYMARRECSIAATVPGRMSSECRQGQAQILSVESRPASSVGWRTALRRERLLPQDIRPPEGPKMASYARVLFVRFRRSRNTKAAEVRTTKPTSPARRRSHSLNLDRHGRDVVVPFELQFACVRDCLRQRHLVRLDLGRRFAHVHVDSAQIHRLVVGETPLAGLFIDDELPVFGVGDEDENRVIAFGNGQAADVKVGIGVERRGIVRAGTPYRVGPVLRNSPARAEDFAAMHGGRAVFNRELFAGDGHRCLSGRADELGRGDARCNQDRSADQRGFHISHFATESKLGPVLPIRYSQKPINPAGAHSFQIGLRNF
jgi:Tannase and feruloyl esterase